MRIDNRPASPVSLLENVFGRTDLTLAPGRLIIDLAQCALYGRQVTGKVETPSHLVIRREPGVPSIHKTVVDLRYLVDMAD